MIGNAGGRSVTDDRGHPPSSAGGRGVIAEPATSLIITLRASRIVPGRVRAVPSCGERRGPDRGGDPGGCVRSTTSQVPLIPPAPREAWCTVISHSRAAPGAPSSCDARWRRRGAAERASVRTDDAGGVRTDDRGHPPSSAGRRRNHHHRTGHRRLVILHSRGRRGAVCAGPRRPDPLCGTTRWRRPAAAPERSGGGTARESVGGKRPAVESGSGRAGVASGPAPPSPGRAHRVEHDLGGGPGRAPAGSRAGQGRRSRRPRAAGGAGWPTSGSRSYSRAS